ncbi:hypothetical protein CDV31_017256 [Fusarium ambrosium]|uniref:Uncharacterized protein n=1 Tax=Fusarium ambrosium TaxID=131363 RepID=A0A428RM87_9HYPO|nr:hypothetical protein CDV31_017256 [Fusarium ambrosium]
MSERTPSRFPSHGQGSYGQFQLDSAQPPNRGPRQKPQSPQDAAFSRLDVCIPKNEDQWQAARRNHGFETPEDVCTTVSALIQDGLLPPDLRRFIYIAVCCVECRKDEDEAFRNYRARTQAKTCSDLTIRNYMSLVRGIIALVDQRYSIIQHRAFEALVLYAPLSLKSLSHYKQAPGRFEACFPKNAVSFEVQASLPLYLPFIITSRCPQYKYVEVCTALHTKLFDENAFIEFALALDRMKCVTSSLPAPQEPQPLVSSEGAHYDAVRGIWVNDVDDVDVTEYVNTEIYAIPSRLTSYKVFDISEIIQQNAATAAKEQVGCAPQEIPGVVSFKFDWSTHHDVVCSQVLGMLVQSGFLSPGEMHLSNYSVRHDSGPITVSSNWLKIVIPTASAAQPATVTLSGEGFKEEVIWDKKTGFLLGAGTTLLPSKTIYYISTSIPTSEP